MNKIVIGIVKRDGNILLVRRRVKEGELHWQFPGGEVELGESESTAVEREIFEETDIRCLALSKLGERQHPITDRFISYWRCEYVSGSAIVKDQDELDIVEWIPAKEVQTHMKIDIFVPVKQFIDAQPPSSE